MKKLTRAQALVVVRLGRGDVLIGSPYHLGAYFADTGIKGSVHPNIIKGLVKRCCIELWRRGGKHYWELMHVGRVASSTYGKFPLVRINHIQARALTRLLRDDVLVSSPWGVAGYFRTGGYLYVRAPTMRYLVLRDLIELSDPDRDEWTISELGRQALEEYNAQNA